MEEQQTPAPMGSAGSADSVESAGIAQMPGAPAPTEPPLDSYATALEASDAPPRVEELAEANANTEPSEPDSTRQTALVAHGTTEQHVTAPAQERSTGRLSRWLLFAAACVIVAASVAAGLAVAHGDWASGASAGGMASLVLAAVYLLTTLLVAVRRGQMGGQRAGRAVLLGMAAVVVFAALGAAGLRSSLPLHLAQARASEANHDWQRAIVEYTLSGASAPNSHDLARVYTEWGDALTQQQQFAQAVQSYFTVLYAYTGVPSAQQPAIAGLWHAYSAWLADSSSAPAYSTIIHDVHAGGQAAWCFGPCQATATLLEAQARFQFGQQLERQGQLNLAISFYETVAPTAPHSQYVLAAHLAAAADYYAIAQLYLRGNTCSQALGAYTQLARNYADTPQGAKAKAALGQPVPVSGVIAGYPTNPAPTVYLSVHVDGTTSFSDEYSTGLDGKGHFTFGQVRPGRYNLSAAFTDGSGRFWHNAVTGDPYFVVVAPLCPLNLGQFQWQ